MKCTTIFSFCSCLISFLVISFARDTITANQILSVGETIVSARGEFEMGFFSPEGRPQNRYFGIWYKKISNGTVIWLANRETPITNSSGIVRVSSRGIMVSTNDSTNSIIIWSSNYSRSVRNPVAQLLDTGNLVFRDENEKETFVWQSFDHIVDTLLPGMKFGYDLVSGIDRYFVPWKTDTDPSPGNYIHRMDRNGYPQIILSKDSDVRFRTGPWVGSKFSGVPVPTQNGIYKPSFVITQTEVYYIFDLVNNSDSALTRLTLTPRGELLRLVWNRDKEEWTRYLTIQVTDCDSYGLCGTYGVCNVNKSPRCECMKGFDPKIPKDYAAADWSNGCLRNVELECGTGDSFLKYPGVKLPDTRWSWYNASMSLFECQAKCLKDCNCTAYSNMDMDNGGSGCFLWFGGLIDIRGYSEDGQDLYVRMAASELEENKDSKRKKTLWILLLLLLIVPAVLLGLYLLHKRRKRRLHKAEIPQSNLTSDTASRTVWQDLDLPLLDFIQVANATGNFSNKLGKGGFGIVYKGILEGQEVAVKRLSKNSRQGVDEFMNEVSCIAKLQHRNLVRLLGCCIENDERMLIYEYMPNKGLDSFIFDSEKRALVDWPKRYNIITGTARGLLYLHQDSRLRIIHRDLKTSNILLDHEMNPKISDFGLARIFGGNETQASTTRIVGTYGYMPPEYAIDGLFSTKSDVYSFGVLLLEIISGKKNRGFRHPEHDRNLLGHVWKSYKADKLLDIAEKMILLDSSNEDEVFRVIVIGLLCVQEYPEDRPSMSSVVLMLTSKIALPTPKKPGFSSERREAHETNSSSWNHSDSSPMNNYSISLFAPR